MRINRIYLDLDETLINTLQSFLLYHQLPNPYLEEKNLGKRAPHEMLGVSFKSFWYNPHPTLWEYLPKYEWADDLVKYCESLVPDNVFILTSPINDDVCASAKQTWVNRYLPKYSRKLVMSSQKHILVDRESLLIDDSYAHEAKFIKDGKADNFILFPNESNRLHQTYYEFLDNPNLALEYIKGKIHNG